MSDGQRNDRIGPEGPPTPKPHQRSWYEKWFTDWWLWELLAVLLSAALTIALCAILDHYNGQPVPVFGSVLNSGITLGTIVALLTTLSVAASLVAVQECLSQLKWLWYAGRSRPLADLETYDRASRGTFGSLQLLWKLRLRFLPNLGALLVIIHLAIVPLAQQSVLSQSMHVPAQDAAATAPVRSQYFDGPLQPQNVEIPEGYDSLGPNMKGAVLGGIFFANSTVPDITPVCTIGNCTISGYQSLAVCWSKADVSSHIKESLIPNPDHNNVAEPNISEFCLPGGHCAKLTEQLTTYVTSAADKTANSTSDLVSGASLNYTSIAFSDHVSPIADVYIFYLNATDPSHSDGSTKLSAVEITLDWCVPTFDTNLVNGTATTLRRPDPFVAFDAEPGAQLTGTVNGTMYEIDLATHHSLQHYLWYLLSGEVYQTLGQSTFTTSDVAEALGQPFAGNSGSSAQLTTDTSQAAALDVLDRILNNTATSMTNLMRNSSSELPKLGIAYAERTVVVVAWGYVAAPILFTVASLLFFLIVATFGRGRHGVKPPVWKTSSDAVLRALDQELQCALRGATTPGAMRVETNGVYVRLVQDGNGWRLAAQGRDDGQADHVSNGIHELKPVASPRHILEYPIR